jgi:hypothetical protein
MHTRALMKEIGFDENEISDYAARGVVVFE